MSAVLNMTRKERQSYRTLIVKRYKAGESFAQIAAEMPFGETTTKAIFAEQVSVKVRTPAQRAALNKPKTVPQTKAKKATAKPRKR